MLCILLSFLMIFMTSGSAFAQVVNAAQEPTQSEAASAPSTTAVSETTAAATTAATTAAAQAVEAANETELRQALKLGAINIKLTEDIAITSPLEISGQGISIDLNGKSISGQNQTQIFSMTEGASAVIKNGTLKDGKTSGDGGAGVVKTSAKLSLDSVAIEGNSADGDGGALSVARGATLNMTNCSFKQNTSSGNGGAVVAQPGSNSTQNALFWVGVVGAAVTIVGLAITVYGIFRQIVKKNAESAEVKARQEVAEERAAYDRVKTKLDNLEAQNGGSLDKVNLDQVFDNASDRLLAKDIISDPGSVKFGKSGINPESRNQMELVAQKKYYSEHYNGHMLDMNNREYYLNDAGDRVYVARGTAEELIPKRLWEQTFTKQDANSAAAVAGAVKRGDKGGLNDQMNNLKTEIGKITTQALNDTTGTTKMQAYLTSNIGKYLTIGGGASTLVGIGSFVGANIASGWSSAIAIGKLFTGDVSGFTSSDSSSQTAAGSKAVTAEATPRSASDGGKIVSSNTTFTGNSAGKDGGVVSLGNSGSGGAQAALLISTNDVYHNNAAGGDGGAVDSAGKVILTNAVVENNTAADGAVNVNTTDSYDAGELTVCGTTTIRDNTTVDSSTEKSNVALDAKATIATENLSMKSSIGVDIDDSVKNSTDSKKVAGDVQIDTTGYETDDTTQALEAAFVSDDTALKTEVYGSTAGGSGDVYMGVSAPTVKTVNTWDEMQQALKDGTKIIEAGSDIKAEAGDTPLSVTSQDTTINLKGHDLSAENQCGVMDISAKNVTVMDGSVSSGSADKGAGVAVEENASTALKAVTLKNNSAAQDGGAVYAQTNSTVSLLNCDVTNNTAGSDGGAVALADFNTKYSAGTGAAVTATGTTFTANEASGNGGVSDIGHGLSTQAGTPSVTYSSCIFTGNKASGDGGVDNNTGAVTHINSTATQNEAGGNGGVISKRTDDTNQGRTVLSGITTFKENACGGEGGATYSNAENDNSNKTTYQGIVKITGNMKDENGIKTDNNVYLPTNAKIDMSGLAEETVAAVIENAGSTSAAQTANSTAAAGETADTAASNAAASTPAVADKDLEVVQESQQTAENAEEDQTAASQDETTQEGTGSSEAQAWAGSVIGVTTEETLVSSVGSREVATASYMNPGTVVKSDNTAYTVTQKTDTAAADTTVKTAILDLTQNVSQWDMLKSALYAQRSNTSEIQRITLTDDITAGAGATTLLISQNNVLIDLNGRTIDGAGLTGIFALADSVTGCTIQNGTIKGGSAENGGAIITGDASKLNLVNVTLSGNTAASNGGALYNLGSVAMAGCTLDGNTAGSGGAIYNNEKSVADIAYCQIQNNKATDGNGGGIANEGQVQLDNDTIMINTAGGNGGGIYSSAAASLALFDQIIVIGNMKADNQTASNLYLPAGTKLNTLALTSGGVGITAEETARPLQITDVLKTDASPYFNSDLTTNHITAQTSDGGTVIYLADGAASAAKSAESTGTAAAAAEGAQQKAQDDQALADSLVIACKGINYGETLEPTVVSNTSGRTVTYQYSEGAKDAWSTAVPTEPGSYKVRGILAKDDKNDEVQSEAVSFTISKALPKITGILAASPITSTQAITDSIISGTADVAGTFSWQNSKIKDVEPGSYAFSVIFTPKDTVHYESLVTQAAVLVTEKAQPITAAIADDGSTLTVKDTATGAAVPVSALHFYKLVKNEDKASQWVALDNTGAYPTEDGTYLVIEEQAGQTLASTISFDKTGSGEPTPEPALTYTINAQTRVDMDNKK